MDDDSERGQERRTMSDRQVEELSLIHGAIQENAAAKRELAAEIARQVWWIKFGTAVLAVVLGVLLFIGVLNRATNNRVADCTIKGGECYSEGRAETGKAVAQLTEAIRVEVQKALDQAECDFGAYCAPGLTPRPRPAGG